MWRVENSSCFCSLSKPGMRIQCYTAMWMYATATYPGFPSSIRG